MGRHRCSNRTTARAQDEAAGSAGAGESRHAGWAWESLYVLWRGALLILLVSLWIKKSKGQHIVRLNAEPQKLSWANLLLIDLAGNRQRPSPRGVQRGGGRGSRAGCRCFDDGG